MTDKKTEELNEQELDQVTGGAADSHDAYANLEVSHLKSSLTSGKGIRATKKIGIRATSKTGLRASKINAEGGGSGI
ncbi:MAG: hypothetical protein ABJN65_12245 [Parasphingorhabdus sp.]